MTIRRKEKMKQKLTIHHKRKMIYEIRMGIEAQSEKQAIDIATDLAELKNLLSDKDLKELVKVIKKNPGIVQTAKKLLG